MNGLSNPDGLLQRSRRLVSPNTDNRPVKQRFPSPLDTIGPLNRFWMVLFGALSAYVGWRFMASGADALASQGMQYVSFQMSWTGLEGRLAMVSGHLVSPPGANHFPEIRNTLLADLLFAAGYGWSLCSLSATLAKVADRRTERDRLVGSWFALAAWAALGTFLFDELENAFLLKAVLDFEDGSRAIARMSLLASVCGVLKWTSGLAGAICFVPGVWQYRRHRIAGPDWLKHSGPTRDGSAGKLRFINWAHRGGHLEVPGNTLAAFMHAAALGECAAVARATSQTVALEMDVRVTKDGYLVVRHDKFVKLPAKKVPRLVERVAFEDLKTFDTRLGWKNAAGNLGFPNVGTKDDASTDPNGHDEPDRKKPEPPPVEFQIPLLDEVLSRFPSQLKVIEIKRSIGAPVALAKALARRSIEEQGRIIVTAMGPWGLFRFTSRMDEVATAPSTVGLLYYRARFLLPTGWIGTSEWARKAGLGLQSRHSALHPPGTEVNFGKWHWSLIPTRRFVRNAHHAGLAVHPWTIDETSKMQRYLTKRVDGIFTDAPDVLRHQLDETPGDQTSSGSTAT